MRTQFNPMWTSHFPFFSWLLSWRMLRRGLILLAAVATLFPFGYAYENWRGKRAWDQFKLDMAVKNEKWDRTVFIPPAVPDNENLASAPIFSFMADYTVDLKTGRLHWSDTRGFERLNRLNLGRSGNTRSLGRWRQAEKMDLKGWQAFYRSQTNNVFPGENANPAEDILCVLGKFDAEFADIRAACQRPLARFPIQYDNSPYPPIPQGQFFRAITLVIRLRASANLALNKSDAALADLRIGWHLVESMKNEPWLSSHLIRQIMVDNMLQPIWEGLANHCWSDAQLQEIQQCLQKHNFLADYAFVMRAERANALDILDLLRKYRKTTDDWGVVFGASVLPRLLPRGWIYQNQVNYGRLIQDKILPLIHVQAHRVYPARAQETRDYVDKHFRRPNPCTIFAGMLCPPVSTMTFKFAYCQAGIDQALIACALDRFRLKQGHYPDTLDTLAPVYLDKIPPDVITGSPLKYKRDGNNRFVLYSIGWNQKDDGGTLGLGRGVTPRNDPMKGDWVWQYP